MTARLVLGTGPATTSKAIQAVDGSVTWLDIHPEKHDATIFKSPPTYAQATHKSTLWRSLSLRPA